MSQIQNIHAHIMAETVACLSQWINLMASCLLLAWCMATTFMSLQFYLHVIIDYTDATSSVGWESICLADSASLLVISIRQMENRMERTICHHKGKLLGMQQ